MNVGIDLGEAALRIARVDPRGIPALIPDLERRRAFSTPAVVARSVTGHLAGEAALQALAGGAAQEVCERPIGADAPARELWGGMPREAGIALLLRKVLRDAYCEADSPLETVVVAVGSEEPAVHDLVARAARALDLDRLSVVPAAHAVASFHARSTEGATLVLDAGAERVRATWVERGGAGGYRTLATSCREGTGSRIVEQALATRALAAVGAARPARVADRLELEVAVRRALSRLAAGQPSAEVTTTIDGRPVHLTSSASEVAEATAELVAGWIDAGAECLSAVGLAWDEVESIALAGALVELPWIADALAAQLDVPRAKLLTRHPRHAAAYGAALLAEQGGGVPASDPLPDIGLQVWDGDAERLGVRVLLRADAPRPAEREVTLYTHRDGQDVLDVQLVAADGQREGGRVVSRHRIDLPPVPVGHPVRLVLRSDGGRRVIASVEEETTGLRELWSFDGGGEELPVWADGVAAGGLND